MNEKPIDPNDLVDTPLEIDENAPCTWEVMPFGKYRGWRFSELPDRYLFWVAANLDLDGALREEIHTEVERRRRPTITPSLSCEVGEAAEPAAATAATPTQRAEARHNSNNRAAAELILQDPSKHGALLVAWARAVAGSKE